MWIALQAVIPVEKARRCQITAWSGGHKRFAFARQLPSVRNHRLATYAHLVTVAQINFPRIGPSLKGLYFLSKELVSQRIPQMATTPTSSLVTQFTSPKQAT